MHPKAKRALAALVLAVAAGGTGYALAGPRAPATPDIPAATVAAPAPGTTRVLYSLTAKRNDQELIALINDAKTSIYFAIYEFTLKDVADALVAAEQRGVMVRGIVDAGESASSYDRPIMAELVGAGIPVVTEKHADGNGIMHIKALVTDSAYAMGSYNWTGSATTENDELLEIGTDPTLRQTYENILRTLYESYQNNAVSLSETAPVLQGPYAYTDAPAHLGEYAAVTGTLVDAYPSASGTIFLDFCEDYKTCPFSGVIFADDVSKFGDLSRYAGQSVTLTGKISSYQGQAEMILSDPSQLVSN